ncbi:MAG: mechanosensitive ion channel [Pirellulales bacterium]
MKFKNRIGQRTVLLACCFAASYAISDSMGAALQANSASSNSIGDLNSPSLELQAVQSRLNGLRHDVGGNQAEAATLEKTVKSLRDIIEVQKQTQELEAETLESSVVRWESEFEVVRLLKVIEFSRALRETTIDALRLKRDEHGSSSNDKETQHLQRAYLKLLQALQARDLSLRRVVKKKSKEVSPIDLRELSDELKAVKNLVSEQLNTTLTDESQNTHWSALLSLQSIVEQQLTIIDEVLEKDDTPDPKIAKRLKAIEKDLENVGDLVGRDIDVSNVALWIEGGPSEHSTQLLSVFSSAQAASSIMDDLIEVPESERTWLSTIKDWFWKAIPEEVGDGENVSVPLPKALGLLFALALASWVALKVSDKIREHILPRLGVKSGQALAIRAIIRYTLFLLFAVVAFRLLDIPLEAFAFVGGAIAIAIGFGSQEIMNNFISGLIMLFEQPIRVGDVVLYQDSPCKVSQIGLRSTRLRHPNNHEITVPNTMLIERPVINMTLSETAVRTFVSLEVDRSECVDEALSKIAHAVASIRCILHVPEPVILLKQADTYYLVFEVHFCIEGSDPIMAMRAQSDVLAAVSKLFPIKQETGDDEHADSETETDVPTDSTENETPSIAKPKALSKEQIRREIARLQAMAK